MTLKTPYNPQTKIPNTKTFPLTPTRTPSYPDFPVYRTPLRIGSCPLSSLRLIEPACSKRATLSGWKLLRTSRWQKLQILPNQGRWRACVRMNFSWGNLPQYSGGGMVLMGCCTPIWVQVTSRFRWEGVSMATVTTDPQNFCFWNK